MFKVYKMEAEFDLPRSIGLDEIVESRLRELLRRISEGSAKDLEPELTSLAKLVDSYNPKRNCLKTCSIPGQEQRIGNKFARLLKYPRRIQMSCK